MMGTASGLGTHDAVGSRLRGMGADPFPWARSTWRQAFSDTNDAARTVQFWMAEAIMVAIGAVVAVAFYPDRASAFTQAGISSAGVVAATLVLIVGTFLANWVAFSARNQRDKASEEVERLRERQDWRALLNNITNFITEGNRAMEAYGRPGLLDSSKGLDFSNDWILRINRSLPDEYRPDFASQGRDIFKGDSVWAELLDVQLQRLREIASDIRNRHL